MSGNHHRSLHCVVDDCSGPDSFKFLQGMVTNNVGLIAKPNDALFAALLNGKGRCLFETIIAGVAPVNNSSNSSSSSGSTATATHALEYLLDVDASMADAMVAHLRRFRLRANVSIDRQPGLSVCSLMGQFAYSSPSTAALPADVVVAAQAGVAGSGAAFVDPRSACLGVRALTPSLSALGQSVPSDTAQREGAREYTRRRVLLGCVEGYANGVAVNETLFAKWVLSLCTVARRCRRRQSLPCVFGMSWIVTFHCRAITRGCMCVFVCVFL